MVVDLPRAAVGKREGEEEALRVELSPRRLLGRVDRRPRVLGHRRANLARRGGAVAAGREREEHDEARHPTGVSHSEWFASEPFTTPKKRSWMRFVIGPTLPSPIG